ncbi:hypothetical protein [Hymenobacter jejuensis]|uniref:Secreted protein n=1 Tax=Hymenobacter jejuensis TaxID=2502781 RepID=A0A5B8A2K1_9BACT|nr:hypothetical protein [Hymenobacter jejuensis]QDA60432.1 hypothetical protein FHG12_10060 [Hymenobacter jejuensis]
MRLFLVAAVLFCGMSAAAAQTKSISPGKQRSENRKALRDARRSSAEYKDSHLAVNKATFKRGASGRQVTQSDGRDKFKFDNSGMPRVSEPSHVSLRLRKKKSTPQN